jgi:hypothetical protein
MRYENVDSQDSFLEFLTILENQAKTEAEKQTRTDPFAMKRFLADMRGWIEASCILKKPIEPSWKTFAMLLAMGWGGR